MSMQYAWGLQSRHPVTEAVFGSSEPHSEHPEACENHAHPPFVRQLVSLSAVQSTAARVVLIEEEEEMKRVSLIDDETAVKRVSLIDEETSQAAAATAIACSDGPAKGVNRFTQRS